MADAPQTKHRLTIQILIGMGLGAVVGLLCNVLIGRIGEAPRQWLLEVGVEGLFRLAGQAFLSLLSVLVVPLVFVSLVCGTAALDDVRKLGRIGIRTVGLYLLTTAIAIPGLLVEYMYSTPGISQSSFSMGLVMRCSISLEPAPGI